MSVSTPKIHICRSLFRSISSG